MQYTIIERDPDAHQQPVAIEQISAMCERAFGSGKEIETVQELDGGEYNSTYLITAVLDSDGASWGDPMDDWTMFLLHIKATEGTIRNEVEGTQLFWQAYGQPERSRGAIFRDQIYRARSFAGGRLENHLQGRADIVLRTYDKLRDIITTLQNIV